jgi:acyl-CoA thioester hydrolase
MTASAYVHRHAVRVGYIDTDRGNVVHHAAYLRWLEHARVEYLRARGLDYRLLELDDQMGLPVVEAKLRYRLPARFDDELAIETRVGRLSRATVRFDYAVMRGEERLVEAEILLACVKLPEGKLMSLPDVVRRACG